MLRIAIIAFALALPAPAGAEDLHRLWDGDCAGCHGHSAAFARAGLSRQGPALARFLERHHGPRPAALAQALAEMLTAQAATEPAFEQHCAICHAHAVELVRRDVIARDGVLYGRYSGRRLDAFLLNHGRLTPEAAERMLAVLGRIEREVNRP